MAIARLGPGGDAVVIEIGVIGSQGVKVIIVAAAKWCRAGFSESGADIDVLAVHAVDLDGLLDGLVDLVGAEQLGLAELAGVGVAPGDLDSTIVLAAEIATE